MDPWAWVAFLAGAWSLPMKWFTVNKGILEMRLAAAFSILIASQVALAQDIAGIGAALTTDGDHVTIGRLSPDGSAAKSEKISVGDWIIAISDETTQETDVSISSIDAVVPLVRGKPGTTVRITLVPKGKTRENAFTIVLTRGLIPVLEKWGDGKLISAGKDFPNIELTMLEKLQTK